MNINNIKENFKDNIHKYLWLFIFFIFYFIMTSLTPLVGDDWGNYLVGEKGILYGINYAIETYFTWEGRFISRILLNFLAYHKILFNLIVSILLTIAVYLISSNNKIKNKKFVILVSILSIIALDIGIQNQVIYWVAGSVTYLFPTILILIYMFYCWKHDNNKKISVFTYILNILFSIIIVMFVENIGICYILFNIVLLIINWRKTQKIDKRIMLNIIFSTIGILAMYLSPGNRARLLETSTESGAAENIFMQILLNIKNFIYCTFTKNAFLICLFTISTYLMSRKYKNKLLTVYTIITGIINIIIIMFYGITGFTNLLKLDLVDNIILEIYWIIYSIVFLILIIKTDFELKQQVLIFLLLGVFANIVMLVSPIWGNRTTICTVIYLGIANIYIIDNYIKENKIINIALSTIIIMGMILFLILHYNIYLSNKYREEKIEEGIKNNYEIITIYNNPYDWLLWNYNIKMSDDYHLNTFKEYYKIEDKEVEIKNTKWKYFIFFDKQ